MAAVPLRVLVTHPGRQHSHQEALALCRSGMLAGYWAGVPSLDRHRLGIPLGIWKRLVRYSPVDLPERLVRWDPWPPVLRKLADRLLPVRQACYIDYAACRLFDRWTARQLDNQGELDAVIACEISARTTFRFAKAKGVMTFLDAPSIHHHAQDSLHGFVEPPALHRRITRIKDEEIALADAVLTVSEMARATYIEAGVSEDKVVAVPLGADLDLFVPGEQSARDGSPFRFIFCGSMRRLKGFDLLVAAFKLLRGAGINVELVVVGPSGDAAGALKTLACGGMTVVGMTPQSDLPRYFQEADCLVLPSNFDSYGMVVAEAMACGVPAIVSTMVGAKDLVREGVTGWIVPPKDLDALAARMRWCAQNPAAVRAMRTRCQRVAAEATWESYRKRFSGTISRMAARHR